MSQSNWYRSENSKPLGPYRLSVLLEAAEKGELRPYDLVANGQGTWAAAIEHAEFDSTHFPAFQLKGQNPADVAWSLIIGGRLQGQLYSFNMLRSALKASDLLSALVWREGMTGWAYLVDRPEFTDVRNRITSSLLETL